MRITLQNCMNGWKDLVHRRDLHSKHILSSKSRTQIKICTTTRYLVSPEILRVSLDPFIYLIRKSPGSKVHNLYRNPYGETISNSTVYRRDITFRSYWHPKISMSYPSDIPTDILQRSNFNIHGTSTRYSIYDPNILNKNWYLSDCSGKSEFYVMG